MSSQNLTKYETADKNRLNVNSLEQNMHIRKISSEQLQQIRKISYESPGSLRKISHEKNLKDPIDILKLNKKSRTKEQMAILCQYFKSFQNLKIIQNEIYFSDKIYQFVNKITYQKFNKGEFIFHILDKNDYFYFILKGQVAGYSKKSEKNLNRCSSPQIFHTQEQVQQDNNSNQLQQNENEENLQNYQNSINQGLHFEDDEYSLLRIHNPKIGQYFEREGRGRPKYNRFQVFQDTQSFGDLSKNYKTFSTVAKGDVVEVIKIQNKDFTHLFDFHEKQFQLTIQTLRKQFEGILSDRILINLSYLFQEDGEILKTGEYIYKEKDIVNKIFLVKEGFLDLIKKVKNIKNKYVEKKISILSKGELFGYESLIEKIDQDLPKEIEQGQEIIHKPSVKKQYHKFSCRSTGENTQIYWLDLNMLHRHDDYEELLIHLAKKGEIKAKYYEERLLKMVQVEEKQHTDKATLQSPPKILQQRMSFKDAIQGLIERNSSNIFDFGNSPSQQYSLTNLNEELISPNLKKRMSQNQTIRSPVDKIEGRSPSLINTSSLQRMQTGGFSPESSPLRKNKTFNILPLSNQNQQQAFSEMIPEGDEEGIQANNQIKLQFNKNRSSIIDEKQTYFLNEGQPKLNKLNLTRNSFSTSYETGYQLKPLYSEANRLNNQQQQGLNLVKAQSSIQQSTQIQGLQRPNSKSGTKLNNQVNSPNRFRQISPFNSQVKLRQSKVYDNNINSENNNLQMKNQQSTNYSHSPSRGQNNQTNGFYNNKSIRTGTQDTRDQIDDSMQLKFQKRSDSSHLLSRKRENDYTNEIQKDLDLEEVEQLIQIKGEIVYSKNKPKVVQLASSGLLSFDEAEKIQRLLKESKTKTTNHKISAQAINNMKSSRNNSPRQQKKDSEGNPQNNVQLSHSLSKSLTKIMKNKKNSIIGFNSQQTFNELNTSHTSIEKNQGNIKNESDSPIKIKSFSQLKMLEDEDRESKGSSSLNQIKLRLNTKKSSSPLNKIYDGEDVEDDSSSNIFKLTNESPKLKLQLHQYMDPSTDNLTNLQNDQSKITQNVKTKNIQANQDSITITSQNQLKQNIKKSNSSNIYKQINSNQNAELKEEINYQNEINDKILALNNKSPSRGGKLQKTNEEKNLMSEIHQVKVQSDDKNMKNITAKLQIATSGSPFHNQNLISLGFSTKLTSGDINDINQKILDSNNQNANHLKQNNQPQNYQNLNSLISKDHPNNLFPSFINNRNIIGLEQTNINQESHNSQNKRSQSSSQNRNKESIPLVLRPSSNDSQHTNNQISQNNSARITLSMEEKKKKNSELSYNQSLIKKGQIRQSLHKKYEQVIQSNTFREKVFQLGESNILNEEINQQSQLLLGTGSRSGTSDGSSRVQNKKLKLNYLNQQHFIMDKNSLQPSSVENSRNISQSLHTSNMDLKVSQNTSLFQTQKSQNQRSLIQSTHVSATERQRNTNSFHKMRMPDQLESKNLSIISQFNSNPIQFTTSNSPIKKNFVSIQKQIPSVQKITSQIAPQSARQSSLTNIHNQISQQKFSKIRQNSIHKNPSNAQVLPHRENSSYSNIQKLLEPICFNETTNREKKLISLHTNS